MKGLATAHFAMNDLAAGTLLMAALLAMVPARAMDVPEVGASETSIVCFRFVVANNGKAESITLDTPVKRAQQVSIARRALMKMKFSSGAHDDEAASAPRKQCFAFSSGSDRPIPL